MKTQDTYRQLTIEELRKIEGGDSAASTTTGSDVRVFTSN